MEKLVRKKSKGTANIVDEHHTSKSSPFNNSIVLKNLFEIGTCCPYKFSSKDLKKLRKTSTKVNDFAKNLQTKFFHFDYSKDYNPLMDNALDETRSAPCNLELHHQLFYTAPHPQMVAKYNRILQLHGQSVKTFVTTVCGLRVYIKKSKEYGLNVLSQLTSLNTIKIYPGLYKYQVNFEKLKNALPNPNILKSLYIENVADANSRYEEFYSYTNSLVNRLLKLFPSLTSLYYGHRIELQPTNAKEFLNRDPRIKFVSMTSTCPKDKVLFKFVEFIQENPAHMTLFETLIEEISQFATNVIVETGDAQEIHIFKSYLQKVKWTRFQEYTFLETKRSRFFYPAQGVLCDCDSGEEYHLQLERNFP